MERHIRLTRAALEEMRELVQIADESLEGVEARVDWIPPAPRRPRMAARMAVVLTLFFAFMLSFTYVAGEGLSMKTLRLLHIKQTTQLADSPSPQTR